MERVLKILAIGVVTFLLIYWIATGFSTCNTNPNKELTQTEELSDSLSNEENIDLEEDIFSDTQDEENKPKSTESANEEESVEDYVDYSGTPKPEKTKIKSQANSTPKTKTRAASNSTASPGGKYLVVAGSYLVENNAYKMKKKLYNLGYNSEIVVFNLSQYHTVLAGRYHSHSDAKNAVAVLKRNGISAYVHRKQN